MKAAHEVLLLIVLLFLCSEVFSGSTAEPSSNELWVADIEALNDLVRKHHPAPFFRLGESQWMEGLNGARALALSGGSDSEVAMTLMSLTAKLNDGHTRLEPTAIRAYEHWLPLRFYDFDDGIFVTVATAELSDLIGQRLLSIQGMPVTQVNELLATATAADNQFMVREGVAAHLSNAGFLHALNVIDRYTDSVKLEFENEDGFVDSRSINIAHSRYSSSYRNWGELFGPPREDFDAYQTPFHDGKAPLEYRNLPNTTDAPFFASRKPFWVRVDHDRSILTFQFNYFADIEDISWDEFRTKLWHLLDQNQPDRFIIDLRYNFGGNGEMVGAFINELMARPHYSNGNRLVVLTGRQTFSASIMLIAELKKHTDALMVGEPPGAPLNQYGDPISLELPSGRLELIVSTLYWQLGHPADRSTVIPVNHCIPFTAQDYFSGVDSVWNEAIELDISQPRLSVSNCMR